MNRQKIARNAKSLLLLTAVGTLSLPAQAHRTRHSATARNYLPKKFIITTFSIVATNIEWDGKTLRYRTDGLEAEAPMIWAIYPSPHAWRQFWKEMDAVKLWQWRTRYNLPAGFGVADGESWKIEIEQQGRKGKKCTSSGSNCYPSDLNVTKPADFREHKVFEHSKVFDRYRTALDNLLNSGRHIHITQKKNSMGGLEKSVGINQ